MLQSFSAGFPDLTSRTTQLIVDGKRVIAINHTSGTNTVALGAMPATHKPTSFHGLAITDYDDAGLIASQVLYADNLNFMGQLGLYPGAFRPVQPLPPAAVPSIDHTGSNPAESDNGAVVRTLAALVGSHERAPIVALYRPDAVLDDVSAAAPAAGTPAIDRSYAEQFTAFPDLAMTDVQVLAAGSTVVATYKLTGTHGGPYPRLRAKAGTMRQIELEVAALFQMQDGKIARHTVFVDGMAAAIQLNLYDVPGGPPPPGAKPPKG